MNSTDKPADIADLIAVMAALRTPVTGCPWDLEQTFATIAPYTIEEAYEVADAIQRGDPADLKDELGDLLLQVVYHSRLAEEQRAFAFPDVVAAVTAKMIRRHPHVFGDAAARSAGAAKGFWERIKAEERAAKAAERAQQAAARGTGVGAGPAITAEPTAGAPSLLDDVPVGLPGLTRAVKLQNKAARVGFDWPDLAPVFDKLREEVEELAEVVLPVANRAGAGGDVAAPFGARTGLPPAPDREGDPPKPTPLLDWREDQAGTEAQPTLDRARITDELGDLLFVIANLARHLEIDPETAVRGANAKFVRRFRHIEAMLAAGRRSPAQSDLAEMDRLWNEAKRLERGS